jgi:hypothetical protein
MSPAVAAIVVLAVAILAGIGLMSLSDMRGTRAAGDQGVPPVHDDQMDGVSEPAGAVDRPARRFAPSPWVLGAIVLLLLGLFVAPRLLGVTFLFLPFLFGRWARGRRGPWMPGGRRPEDFR